MGVIANVFPKLQTVKKLVRTLAKKHSFRTRFDKSTYEIVTNTCYISMTALLSCFFMIHIEVDLENVSPSV